MAISVKNSRRGGLLWLHLDWPARKVDRGSGREPRRWEMIIDLLGSNSPKCLTSGLGRPPKMFKRGISARKVDRGAGREPRDGK